MTGSFQIVAERNCVVVHYNSKDGVILSKAFRADEARELASALSCAADKADPAPEAA